MGGGIAPDRSQRHSSDPRQGRFQRHAHEYRHSQSLRRGRPRSGQQRELGERDLGVGADTHTHSHADTHTSRDPGAHTGFDLELRTNANPLAEGNARPVANSLTERNADPGFASESGIDADDSPKFTGRHPDPVATLNRPAKCGGRPGRPGGGALG